MVEDKKAADEKASTRKKLPIKTALIVLIIMVVEAGFFIALQIFAGGPADVKAIDTLADQQQELEKPIEVLVIDGRFNNNKTGRTIIYDTLAYVVVKKKYEETVQNELASMKATIEEDMRTIVSRADPTHLGEPTLSTLKRQFHDALDARLKPDKDGKSRVEDVRISRFIPIRAD